MADEDSGAQMLAVECSKNDETHTRERKRDRERERTRPAAKTNTACCIHLQQRSHGREAEKRRRSKSRLAANPWPRPTANRSLFAPLKMRRIEVRWGVWAAARA